LAESITQPAGEVTERLNVLVSKTSWV
jgi:hypothetical protein